MSRLRIMSQNLGMHVPPLSCIISTSPFGRLWTISWTWLKTYVRMSIEMLQSSPLEWTPLIRSITPAHDRSASAAAAAFFYYFFYCTSSFEFDLALYLLRYFGPLILGLFMGCHGSRQ